MSLTSPQNRSAIRSMGVAFLVPPVLYLTGSVILVVREQLNGVYPVASAPNPFTLPPITQPILLDAVYVIVRRYVRGQFVYYTERFDDRFWQVAEDCWCVDSALAYPLFAPNATLTASASNGTQNITSYIVIDGGTGYVAPAGTVNDPTGSGATMSFTVVGGVITSAASTGDGSLYTNPSVIVTDSAGSGAIIQPVITNYITLSTDQPVFASSQVGNVIRMGGGIMTVVSYTDTQHVIANVTTPITSFPSDPGDQPIPSASGSWSMGVPTSTVSGLNHLEGLSVTGLADGQVISPRTVTNGAITLDGPATMITVGLAFTAQMQTLRLDVPGEGTVQGKRKTIQAVTVRLDQSRGVQVGTNQPDSAAQPNTATIEWSNMIEWKQRNNNVQAGNAMPLFTGDARLLVKSSWRKEGQIAVQQNYPLPANVIAALPEFALGDDNG